jgi:uncharacterized protein (DUF2147 family)
MTRRVRTQQSVLVLISVLGLAGSATAGGGTPKEVGIWYDDTGKGAVRIEQCENKLCGKIYWLKDTLNAEGKPLIDRHNPNESQRTRPICGLQVIGGLASMSDGEWDAGWIYDPKEGKSYSVAMKLDGPDTMKVTGYLVMKLMGRTLTWKRAPADLPSCAANAAQTPGSAATKTGTAAAPAAKAAAKAAAKPAAAGGEELPWADSKDAKKPAPCSGAARVGAPKPQQIVPQGKDLAKAKGSANTPSASKSPANKAPTVEAP